MATRDFSLHRYRNVGIIAHIDAGKTTTTERVLVLSGVLRRAGVVHHGTTATDHLPEEIKHKITISAAAVCTRWAPLRGPWAGEAHRLQWIDTPGHLDFGVEVERALRVLDGAVCVLDAAHGVEPQSETVWRQADRHGVPRLVFVNKMDKSGADLERCLRSLRERLGVAPACLQLPLGEGSELRGVVDLVEQRALAWSGPEGARAVSEEPVPEALTGAVLRARRALVELVAERDEECLRLFVEQGPDVSPEALHAALRRCTLARTLVPVLCGSAFRDVGVQPLLDAVVHYLPSPEDLPPARGVHPETGEAVARAARDEEPPCALVFKLVLDPFVGALAWARVYSGALVAGTVLRVAATGRTLRVGRLVRVQASEREQLSWAGAGDLVALVGVGELRTGDTLCAPEHPVTLEALHVPEPVVERTVEARNRADTERASAALARYAAEDPTVRLGTDPESGLLLLRGMGELHLQLVVERVTRESGLELRLGTPRVAWRTTAARRVRLRHRYKRQSGGPGHFAEVELEVAPAPRGAGLRFEDCTVAGSVPREFLPGVERGLRGAMERGVDGSAPVVDLEVRLLGGAWHEQDSSVQSFEVASSLALQQALREGGLQWLEPRAALTVDTPAEHLGAVLGDLAARRGQVRGTEPRGAGFSVEAVAPLAQLFGYVEALRARTQGRAAATVAVEGYAPCAPPTQAA